MSFSQPLSLRGSIFNWNFNTMASFIHGNSSLTIWRTEKNVCQLKRSDFLQELCLGKNKLGDVFLVL